jgi:putative restriction endonuclease
MRHGSKEEVKIWDEFNGNWEELAYESERLLASFKGIPIEKSSRITIYDIPKEGKERETIIKTRVNQNFFRLAVLSSYNNKCCITGIEIPSLLVASHIIPWSKNKTKRLNPQNGLCMNTLHDKAFDSGLITVSANYRIVLSSIIKKLESREWVQNYFLPYENKEIFLPQRFYPDKECLEYHYNNIFLKD